MAFTPTIIDDGGPRPSPPDMEESWSYVNTGGSSGGVITARHLSLIRKVEGTGIIGQTIAANAVTIVTDSNNSGTVTLIGRGN